jgi:hypothetical protein
MENGKCVHSLVGVSINKVIIISRLCQFWKTPNGNMLILSYKAFAKEKIKIKILVVGHGHGGMAHEKCGLVAAPVSYYIWVGMSMDIHGRG